VCAKEYRFLGFRLPYKTGVVSRGRGTLVNHLMICMIIFCMKRSRVFATRTRVISICKVQFPHTSVILILTSVPTAVWFYMQSAVCTHARVVLTRMRVNMTLTSVIATRMSVNSTRVVIFTLTNVITTLTTVIAAHTRVISTRMNVIMSLTTMTTTRTSVTYTPTSWISSRYVWL
jgi:hypothetical protein